MIPVALLRRGSAEAGSLMGAAVDAVNNQPLPAPRRHFPLNPHPRNAIHLPHPIRRNRPLPLLQQKPQPLPPTNLRIIRLTRPDPRDPIPPRHPHLLKRRPTRARPLGQLLARQRPVDVVPVPRREPVETLGARVGLPLRGRLPAVELGFRLGELAVFDGEAEVAEVGYCGDYEEEVGELQPR